MGVKKLLNGLIVGVLVLPQMVNARLLIDPGRPGSRFVGQVNECLAEIEAAGPPFSTLLDQLRNSRHTHTIREIDHRGSSATNDTNDAWTTGTWGVQSGWGGPPGSGSGSTIEWNPTYNRYIAFGTRVDPCAALLHEMAHSGDFDQGRGSRRSEPGTGNPNAHPRQPPIDIMEVDASRMENRFRRHSGRPPGAENQRQNYGYTPLPANAIF